MKNYKKEIENLKNQLECLNNDYYDEINVTTEIMVMQEEFLNYLKNKIKNDKKNKNIYDEIIKEFEKIMI